MWKKTGLVISALLIAATGTYADIYKCVSENGVVRFSDQPCGKSAKIIPDTNLSVDEAIGNASPFSEPVRYSYSIRYDVMYHAKKVGKSLFPNEYLIEDNISAEYQDSSPTWTVFLSYGYRQYPYDYSKIELDYISEKRGKKIIVRLKYIRMNRSDLEIPLPTLDKSKKMKRDRHRGWYILSVP